MCATKHIQYSELELIIEKEYLQGMLTCTCFGRRSRNWDIIYVYRYALKYVTRHKSNTFDKVVILFLRISLGRQRKKGSALSHDGNQIDMR